MNEKNGTPQTEPASTRRARGSQLPNAGKPWSDEDDRILTENYVARGTKHTARMLGRSNKAVVQRAHELGVLVAPRRGWTQAEDDYLRKHYETTTAPELAADLDRTEQSVRGRIFLLGLTTTSGRGWSEEELSFLRKKYGKITLVEIARILGRTHASVEVKAQRLGLRKRPVYRPYGAEDIEHVKEHLGSMPATQIAAKLGLAVHTVYRIARDLGYRDRPTSRAWTPEEDAELKQLFGVVPRAEIAARMNRTELAITVRAQALHLTRQVKRARTKLWTHREEERLRLLARRLTIAEIAEKLDRTPTSISGKMRLLGLKPLRKKSAAGEPELEEVA